MVRTRLIVASVHSGRSVKSTHVFIETKTSLIGFPGFDSRAGFIKKKKEKKSMKKIINFLKEKGFEYSVNR